MTNKPTKSKKPENSAFKQQRLKAWQPLLTYKSVLPTLFLIGLVFVPLGGFLFWTNEQLTEITIDYTNCDQASETFTQLDEANINYKLPSGIENSAVVKWMFQPSVREDDELKSPPKCIIQFPILAEIKPPVYIYYKLTNFYQNHRNYIKSVSYEQLKGSAVHKDQLASCEPLATMEEDGVRKPIYPCGLIANSMFNDTFTIKKSQTIPDAQEQKYQLDTQAIAWQSDKDRYKPTDYTQDEVVPPPNWSKYKGSYKNKDISNIVTDPHFQVWMRTAALPNFKKLYGVGNQKLEKSNNYVVEIEYNFDTREYKGTKSFVIATTSFLGAKNSFLGLSYIIVGGICFLLAILFTARHLYKPRRLGDHSYLSWNNVNEEDN